jgi:predicted RNase H-like nuclease (RuvC/YqgF family)
MNNIKNHINELSTYIKNIEDENKSMKEKIYSLENEMNELSLFIEKKVNNIKIVPLKESNMERIKKYFDKRRRNRKSLIIKKRYCVDSDFDSDDDYTNIEPNEEIEVKEIDVIKKLFKDDLFNFTKK